MLEGSLRAGGLKLCAYANRLRDWVQERSRYDEAALHWKEKFGNYSCGLLLTVKGKGSRCGQVGTKWTRAYAEPTRILRGSLRREAHQILALRRESLQ